MVASSKKITAYDLNPTPRDIKPRVLSTSIDLIDPTASLELAIGVAQYFDLDNLSTKKIVKEVCSSTSTWREEAAKLKIKKTEIDRMSTAFEHEDMQKAIK